MLNAIVRGDRPATINAGHTVPGERSSRPKRRMSIEFIPNGSRKAELHAKLFNLASPLTRRKIVFMGNGSSARQEEETLRATTFNL